MLAGIFFKKKAKIFQNQSKKKTKTRQKQTGAKVSFCFCSRRLLFFSILFALFLQWADQT
jgi:hypothetical protein